MFVERVIALIGLIVISPLLAIIALAVLLDSGKPVMFRQVRLGRRGKPFHLLKFRTMVASGTGPLITRSGDPRITRVGAVLRKYKLDELLQAWNVVRGEMSLIGPRPEVPKYVDLADPVWRTVLEARPGISDLAALVYRNEEDLLSAAPDPERLYRQTILPDKLALSLRYRRRRSLAMDCRLTYWTLRYSFSPRSFSPERARHLFS